MSQLRHVEPGFVDFVPIYDSQHSPDEVDRLIAATLDAPDNPALGNYNVPLALVENNSEIFGHSPKDSDSRYARYGREGAGFALGPMPVNAFLETFCPCSTEVLDKMPSAADAFIKVPRAADAEEDIYNPLITALNQSDGQTSRCPGYTFMDASTHADAAGNCTVKPDVLCYANEHVSRVQIKGSISRTDMGFATFFIEIKSHSSQDFFEDPYAHWRSSRAQPCWFFRRASKTSRFLDDFGQQVVYATELCARQFRHCCFSVALFGCKARIMRWDRAGVIVTRQFDLHHNPEILCEFVWRYAHMSETQRGMDMTVVAASDAEETLFQAAIKTHVALQLGLSGKPLQAAVYQHYQPNAVCAIGVFDATTREERRYLVSRPLTSPLSVTGRATRSYWAVDAQTGQVVCLKDTWRLSIRGAEQEGTVIASLAAEGVRNIPAVLDHGDVPTVLDTKQSTSFDCMPKRTTVTHQFVDAKWVCEQGIDLSTIVEYTQYRLVISIAGYALHNIFGTAELLSAGCHVLQAIIDAFGKKRVHRNIHPSSVVLYRDKPETDRRGILLDWDLSWHMKSTNPHRHLPFDAMWQFMSISILGRKKQSHSIQDDMESLLYSLLYCALRWLDHTLEPTPGGLPWLLQRLFDDASWQEDQPEGGNGKHTNAMSRKYTALVHFKSPSLHKWLNMLMDFHRPKDEEYRVGMRYLSPEPQPSTTAQWLDPKGLEELWVRFMEDHHLERNDRVVRTLPHESREIAEKAPALPATLPSTFSESEKPDADELRRGDLGLDSGRPSKKRKTSSSDDGYTQASAHLNHLHTGTLERITALTIPKDDPELKAPSAASSAVAPARKKSPKRRVHAKRGKGSKTKRK
ncbi:hypothetical protein C8Q73DRAFT_793249 [Cubamyces lactineus]|nr:hypothetical protein C8Q73DRAFT_793249 [Cubamyces lactineus]